MKKILSLISVIIFFLSCNTPNNSEIGKDEGKKTDTLTYAYKATYSSDITVPSKPEIGQMVLTVWKMFENRQIDLLKKFYADTVTYDNSDGFHFNGSSGALLDFAHKDVEGLDSLRFDISMLQSLHLNDRNEDWVYIWAAERRYPKGGKSDTSLIHEQWKVENGRVSYFNQYKAKPAGK